MTPIFPRPMRFTPAIEAHLIPQSASRPLAFTPAETEEWRALKEALRSRRSVDHFARAWYGGIGSLILSGLAAKLFHDRPESPWLAVLLGSMGVVGWSFAVTYFVRSRRASRREQEMLVRLRSLDARAPKEPELF
jgi:hypothetical protein